MNIHPSGPQNDTPVELERVVSIPIGKHRLEGTLAVPADPAGLVLFAHGSGSGRRSPRNRAVARTLQQAGMATLLFDLLTEYESGDRSNVFDVALLAERLGGATAWCRTQPDFAALPQGFFGASTGAGAALVAAAKDPAIRAVVSRGGRPDLAGDYLPLVKAPTLLIVGGADVPVIQLNEEALKRLTHIKSLVIVPGATHLFEEAGALDHVAHLAAGWFTKYLPKRQGS